MRIALIGAGGQLAHDVLDVTATRPGELTVFPLSHSQIEVTSLASIKSALGSHPSRCGAEHLRLSQSGHLRRPARPDPGGECGAPPTSQWFAGT